MNRTPAIARIRRVHQYDNEETRNSKEFTSYTFTLDIVTTQGEQYKNVPVVFPSSSLDGKGFRYIPYAGVKVVVLFTNDGPVVIGYIPEHEDLDGFADSCTLQEQGAWSSSSPSGSSVLVGDRKASLTASPDSMLVLDGVNGTTSLLSKNCRALFPGGYYELQVLPDSQKVDKYFGEEKVIFNKIPKDSDIDGEYLYSYSGYSTEYAGFINREIVSRVDGLMKLTQQRSPREMQISITEDRQSRPKVPELNLPTIWEPDQFEIRKSARQPRIWDLPKDKREESLKEGSNLNSWLPGPPDIIPEGVIRLESDPLPVKHVELRLRPQEFRIKTADTEVVLGQNAEIHTHRTYVTRAETIIIQADNNADGELKTPLESGESGSRISMKEAGIAIKAKQISFSGNQEISMSASNLKLRGNPDWPEMMQYITKLEAKVTASEAKISGLEGRVSQLSSQIASIK